MIRFNLFLILNLLFAPTLADARIVIDITSAELRKVPTAVPYFINKDLPDTVEDRGRDMAALLAEALDFHGFICIKQC